MIICFLSFVYIFNMVCRCCVPNCKGNYKSGPTVSSFSFPKDALEIKKWLQAIHRENLTSITRAKVCELHFPVTDIMRESIFDFNNGDILKIPLKVPRLRPSAVPSLLPNCPEYLSLLSNLKVKEAKVGVKKEIVASEVCFIKEEVLIVEDTSSNATNTNIHDKADKLEMKNKDHESQTVSSAQHARVSPTSDPQDDMLVHAETVDAEPIEHHPNYILNYKSFACNKCPFICNNKINLSIHKRKHTESSYLFACDKCSYKTKFKHTLTKHKYHHKTLRKFFACDQCSYKSIRLSDLVKHNFSHIATKKYSCDLCSYSYYQKSHLVLHKLTQHRKAVTKLFSCDKCAFICNDKYTLISHKESHAKETTFHCDLCTFSSSWEGSLVSHTLSMH